MNNVRISTKRIDELERIMIMSKLESLNGNIAFNCKVLDFEYLIKLHKYLFVDMYGDVLTNTRNMNDKEKKIINKILLRVNEVCKNNRENVYEIIKLLHNVWYLQPFTDGNTRTLIGYLMILKEYYDLDIDFYIHDDVRDLIKYKKLELIKKQYK